MKIFISWSGERSKVIAHALRTWLPKVIQAVKPWMSNEDIESGMKWSNEISGELESSNFGIICITRENQNSPWISFEAGALSKIVESSNVCPYLFEMAPSQLSGPLSQFQARQTNKEGTLKILKTINKTLKEAAIKTDELEEIFEVWWPKLEKDLKNVPKHKGEKIQKRNTEEILSEIVVNTREQLRREEVRITRSSEFDKKMDKMIEGIEKFATLFSTDVNNLPSAQYLPKAMTDMVKSMTELKDLDANYNDKLLKGNIKKKTNHNKGS